MIKAEISLSRLGITPFEHTLINPSSIDVRLGRVFSQVVPSYIHVDPTNHLSFVTKEVGKDTFILKPGEMVLSSLAEHIKLPADISAKLLGKSSLGRLGLDNSSCSGWIDPGFKGAITIELFNHSSSPIFLTSGMKIGQLIFFKHPPAELPYGEKPTSKYQGQSGVQGSLGV